MTRMVMIDTETLGIARESVVCTVGAVAFDDELGWDQALGFTQWHLDWETQRVAGRTVEFGTVKWWLTQNAAAQGELIKEATLPIRNTLEQITDFVGLSFVWSNPAVFDLEKLRSMCDTWGVSCWPWYNQMCYRTVRSLMKKYGMDKLSLEAQSMLDKVPTVPHTALDDAYRQTIQLLDWLRR